MKSQFKSTVTFLAIAAIEELVPADSFNIVRSLSPLVVFYNVRGTPIHASATLDGSMPKILK